MFIITSILCRHLQVIRLVLVDHTIQSLGGLGGLEIIKTFAKKIKNQLSKKNQLSLSKS